MHAPCHHKFGCGDNSNAAIPKPDELTGWIAANTAVTELRTMGTTGGKGASCADPQHISRARAELGVRADCGGYVLLMLSRATERSATGNQRGFYAKNRGQVMGAGMPGDETPLLEVACQPDLDSLWICWTARTLLSTEEP